MQRVRQVVVLIAALASVLIAPACIEAGRGAASLRQDLATLNDIRFGMLNAEKWAAQLDGILRAKIDNFEITAETRPVLREHIAALVRRIIDEFETIERRRIQGGSLEAAVQHLVRGAVVDMDALRANAPAYADAIIDEASSDRSRTYFKSLTSDVLSRVLKSAVTPVDMSPLVSLRARYGCTGDEQCRLTISSLLSAADGITSRLSIALVVCVLVCLGTLLTSHLRASLAEVGLAVAALAAILVAGVMLPMIRMEAKIVDFEMTFLDGTVRFFEQVLYFENKSILDVMRVLADSGKAELLLVAVLVGLFSVVFPFAKLSSTLFVSRFGTPQGVKGTLLGFFAYRSAKWAMADVMVVAMLMAFVGFRGLIASKLGDIAGISKAVQIETANGTALQSGFFLFLTFALLGIALTHVIERKAA